MARPSVKKQIFIFIIGSILNLLLFCITKYTPFPFWPDYAGTLYIAVLCGPILAIPSLILHTAIPCMIIDGAGWSALLPAISILLVILLIYYSHKSGEKNAYKSISTAFLSGIVCFICNTVIFLCCKMPLGRYAIFSEIFSAGINTGGKLFASVVLAAAISFTEIFLTFIILECAWLLTPKRENIIFKK